jgi:hypothetical protein
MKMEEETGLSEQQQLQRVMLKGKFAKEICGISRFSILLNMLKVSNPNIFNELIFAGYSFDKKYSKKYLTPKQMAIILKYFRGNGEK